MKTDVKNNIAKIVFLALSIAGAIALFGDFSGDVKVKLDTSKGMSSSSRVRDFSKLCRHLEKNLPVLYEYEELYGIKYGDVKAYYKNLIGNAESDYEYYAYIQGFVNNIPGGHLTLGYPDMNAIPYTHINLVNDNRSFAEAQPYWENVLREECAARFSDDTETVVFYYAYGKYIGSSGSYDNDRYGVNNAELLSADGIAVDEFIKLHSSVSKIKYDHVNGKPFRDSIIFNDSFGTPCETEYRTADGSVRKEKMYCGTLSDVVLLNMGCFTEESGTGSAAANSLSGQLSEVNFDETDFTADIITVEGVTAVRDTERDILFMSVPSFALDSRYAKELFTRLADDFDNVIIDIRENRGGLSMGAEKLLSGISMNDIDIDEMSYIKTSAYINNFDYYKDITDGFDMSRRMLKVPQKASVKGELAQKKNIYLLVSDNTLSAADEFASEFKRNGLGTVLGTNNTGGEKYSSPIIKILENSGLYIYYPEIKCINPDGTDNSLYGTAPDIYVPEDPEKFGIKQDMILSGEEPYTYEGHLLWDESLIKAVELIKDKENG